MFVDRISSSLILYPGESGQKASAGASSIRDRSPLNHPDCRFSRQQRCERQRLTACWMTGDGRSRSVPEVIGALRLPPNTPYGKRCDRRSVGVLDSG
jgi:hypothetical protein